MVFFCKVGINDEKKWNEKQRSELSYYPYIYIITHGIGTYRNL